MEPRTFIHSDAPANAPFSAAELAALGIVSSDMFRTDFPDFTAYCWPVLTNAQASAAGFLTYFGVLSYDQEHGVYVLTAQGVERATATALQLGKG